MSRDTVRKVAIIIGVIFVITILVYPLIYSPEPPVDAADEISTPVPMEPGMDGPTRPETSQPVVPPPAAP
jgi:hypothetical protein